MANFNLTVIRPDGFLHSSGFNEVVDSLAWALSALGHQANVTQNWFSEHKEHNILFGLEQVAEFQRLPKNSTIFNLEQPGHPYMDKVRRIAKESGCRVWDYSHRAIAEWKTAGIEATHVPIGYTPNLTRIPASDNEDIDVLFYGWLTDRRRHLIDELSKYGLNVVSTAACYGGGRDQLISRAKVILNVHHDGRDRFEVVRCSYLMANSRCVVSESSSDDDEYQDLRGINIVPYRLLVDLCRSLCSAYTERFRNGQDSLDSIRKRDFTHTVGDALDASAAPVPAPSRPLEFAAERGAARTEFIEKARNLAAGTDIQRPRDPRVASRYSAAAASGDMKDFVAWMRDHAKGNIVEIGVRDGASTSAFLSGVEEHGGHVYSIDVQPCGALFSGHPQWSFLQANSTDLSRVIRFIPYEIDLLLIDGDHSRAGVINDMEYARQVHAGGLVLFHDIAPEQRPSGCNDMSWPGDDVRRVFFEYVEALTPMGWTHEELPGRYGMGILRKSPMTPPPAIAPVEEEVAK